MKIFDLFNFNEKIQVVDVGAAAIAETPIYKILLDKKIAHLNAFDGDQRQIEKLKETYDEENLTIFNYFLFDGKKHHIHLCSPQSGMTSLFKPKIEALNFFNGFSEFGKVEKIEEIQTTKLDNVDNLKATDFLKMDVQGAELGILKNGSKKLKIAWQYNWKYPIFRCMRINLLWRNRCIYANKRVCTTFIFRC